MHHLACVGRTLDTGASQVPPFCSSCCKKHWSQQKAGQGAYRWRQPQGGVAPAELGGSLALSLTEASTAQRFLSLPHPCRACASSETESEAGDIMDQQFEEMNNRLNSVTDPTGFLRMVRRNNLLNRCVWPCLPGPVLGRGPQHR